MPIAFPKPPTSPVGNSWYPPAFPNAPRSHQVQSKHDKNKKINALAARLEYAWEKKPASGLSSKLRAREHDQSRVLLNICLFFLMQIISVNPAEGLKSVWGNLFLPIFLGHCRPLPTRIGIFGWTLLLETLVEYFSRKPWLDTLPGNFGWSLELEI